MTGAVHSFGLTQDNPYLQFFAGAETEYAQAWGLKNDGNVLLSRLNNANFSGANRPGASKLNETLLYALLYLK